MEKLNIMSQERINLVLNDTNLSLKPVTLKELQKILTIQKEREIEQIISLKKKGAIDYQEFSFEFLRINAYGLGDIKFDDFFNIRDLFVYKLKQFYDFTEEDIDILISIENLPKISEYIVDGFGKTPSKPNKSKSKKK